MDRNKLKSYAPAARRDFIKAVSEKANLLGLSEKKIEPASLNGDVAVIMGKTYPKYVYDSRLKLINKIAKEGLERVIERIAYTWFNRFLALRFMEIHSYLGHGYRVLSNSTGRPTPEILENADRVQFGSLNKEKVILGFYLSGHPLDKYREEVYTFSTVTIDSVDELKDGQHVRLCGILTDLKKHIDRKKRTMVFLKIEDFTGSLEGIVFSDPYEKYQQNIYDDSLVMVMGKINTRETESAKILIDEVITLDEARKRFTKNLCLAFETEQVSESLINELKELLENYKGEIPVFFNVKTPDKGDFVLRLKSVKVSPSLELVEQLRDKVGRENVWVGA